MELKKLSVKLNPNQFRKIKLEAYERDGYHCQLCNSNNLFNYDNLHPHHIIPKGRFRLDVLENILTVCGACHTLLHDNQLEVSVDGLIEQYSYRLEKYIDYLKISE